MMRLIVAIVALTVLTACSRSRPLSRDRIRFTHGSHLRAGVGCTECHGSIPTVGTAATPERRMELPSEQRCRSCHTREEQQRCEYCHTSPRAPMPYQRVDRELIFSHASHAPRVNGNCVSCHGIGTEARTASAFEPRVPDMQGCAGSCHAQDMRALTCNRCHSNLRRYAIDEVAIVRHGPGFARHHGAEARASGGLCSQCHEPTYCARCHTGSPGLALADLEPMAVVRDFVHRGDFRARHAEEARFSTATCLRCHGAESCDGCHRASGIGGGVGPSNTHPPGWLDPGSPNGHARAARRNLIACVSCHESDAVQVCTPCHRSGGAAGNPHPPGFSAGIEQQRHAICLACHAGVL